MKRSASTALTLLALAACTGEPRAPERAPVGSSGNGGSAAAPNEAPGVPGAALQPAAGIGSDTDAGTPASTRGGGSNAATEPGSAFPVVDVPAGPCVESDAAPRTLVAADAAGITFDRAGRVADRYFAFDSASLAFVTFAADAAQPGDGALASALVYADVVALSGDDSSLRALEIDEAGKLVVSRFDVAGVRASTSFELDGTNTTHHALLATGERALAAWNVTGELRGRLLGADGPHGPAFDYGAGSCGDHGCQPVLLEAPGRFVLLWGRVLHDGTFGIGFSVINPDGEVLTTKPVLASFAEYRLVDAVLLADESIALLIAEGFPSRGALLQRLDPVGNVAEPAQRLLGAVEPWAIASDGMSLAVVARSATDRAMLRTFSASNTPSEHWTCLDDNLAGEAFAPRAVVLGTRDGYGLVVRRMDGSSAFAVTAAP
jgi:hypothetical protein